MEIAGQFCVEINKVEPEVDVGQPLALGVAQALDALGLSHRRLLIQGGRPKDCDWFYIGALVSGLHHQTDDIMRGKPTSNNPSVPLPPVASSIPCLGIEPVPVDSLLAEHATYTANIRVFRIQNPAGHARTFTFDRGWREIALRAPC